MLHRRPRLADAMTSRQRGAGALMQSRQTRRCLLARMQQGGRRERAFSDSTCERRGCSESPGWHCGSAKTEAIRAFICIAWRLSGRVTRRLDNALADRLVAWCAIRLVHYLSPDKGKRETHDLSPFPSSFFSLQGYRDEKGCASWKRSLSSFFKFCNRSAGREDVASITERLMIDMGCSLSS